MYNDFDNDETLLSTENEINCLKNEILEKTNYLDKEKNEIALKIKNSLREDMISQINQTKNENKIKRFFKKLLNTCM